MLHIFQEITQQILSSHHKWSLLPKVTTIIFQRCGSSQIDTFMTKQNRKCHQLCSLCRHSLGSLSDAYLLLWTELLFFAFPPVPLVHKVLLKIKWDKARVIFITLVWLHQHWFGTRLDLSIAPSLLLLLCLDLLSQEHDWLLHLNLNFLHPNHMEVAWLHLEEQVCWEQAQQVLMGSRKPSTRVTFLAKWKQFSIWSFH